MKQRIGIVTTIGIVAVALIVDGIQFLLTLTVLGSIPAMVLSVASWTLFFIWFALLGVSYFDRGAAVKLFTAFASMVAELVPFINALPALTLGVVALIFYHNREVEKQERRNRPARPRVRPVRTAANDNAPPADQQRAA